MSVTIYHNPRCSKSRATLALLQERGTSLRVVEYLETPPTRTELSSILKMLNLTPLEFMRQKEPPFAALGPQADQLDDDALIDAMIAQPILIERPVVVNGNRAAIGRPPESVLDIL